MYMNANAIEIYSEILECMTEEEIGCVTIDDDHISAHSTYVIHGWSSRRAQVIKEVQPNWSFRDEVAVIDDIAMKGRKEH